MDFFIPILNTLLIAGLLILLMVGLMFAPWQVLLLILVLGILSYQWLIRRHHLQGALEDINSSLETDVEIQSEEHAESASNQVLQYRGASYSPSTAAPDRIHSMTEVTGQYRGGLRKFSL